MFTIPHHDGKWNIIATAIQLHTYHLLTAYSACAAEILNQGNHFVGPYIYIYIYANANIYYKYATLAPFTYLCGREREREREREKRWEREREREREREKDSSYWVNSGKDSTHVVGTVVL